MKKEIINDDNLKLKDKKLHSASPLLKGARVNLNKLKGIRRTDI